MQKWKAHVANATVQLQGLGGCGVLVTGGFILTATHCIRWNGSGGMTRGNHYSEIVSTKNGYRFRVGISAADPVSDMAALSALNEWAYSEDYDAFKSWRESTCPVTVRNQTLRVGDSLPVHILTHNRSWIDGRVCRYGYHGHPQSGSIFMETNAQIDGGTSGSPVVDSDGNLIGVFSQFGSSREKGGPGLGKFPIAKLALPRWIWASIRSHPIR
jgi:S1-C subfamily serine protease